MFFPLNFKVRDQENNFPVVEKFLVILGSEMFGFTKALKYLLLK